jgi:hypothetical protein
MTEFSEFPRNLELLHLNEERLRAAALDLINRDEHLKLHVNLIERAINIIQIYIREIKNKDEDELLLQLLGIRISNAAASALKLLLGGYIQAAAMLMRDILETKFLLDLFRTEHEQRAAWRLCSEDERFKKFKPKIIRDALDKRDGFSSKKRDAAYKLLSQLAGHPTYVGFQMLKPEKDSLAHPGPFFSPVAFRAALEELSRLMLLAGEIWGGCFISVNSETDYAKKSFDRVRLRWLSIAFPSVCR